MALHAFALMIVLLLRPSAAPPPKPADATVVPPTMMVNLKELPLVFKPASRPSSGGGGGGARQKAPIPKAQERGTDRVTLPVARPPVGSAPLTGRELPFHAIDIPARPLASGTELIVGLPNGIEGAPLSRGPGSGGGVGEGSGTGAGSGTGTGLGPGSGGGMGGGIYVPGGGVSAPVLLTQVRPSYTPDALRNRVQGTVVLEAIVRRNGVPDPIRIVRSLDPGLDAEAMAALRQWRFLPGRFGDTPVDILVSVEIAFRIH